MVSSLSNSGGVGGGGGDVCAPGISRGAGNVKDTEWGERRTKTKRRIESADWQSDVSVGSALSCRHGAGALHPSQPGGVERHASEYG
jgi:hypothetical protein